jgi:hypothetical protein
VADTGSATAAVAAAAAAASNSSRKRSYAELFSFLSSFKRTPSNGEQKGQRVWGRGGITGVLTLLSEEYKCEDAAKSACPHSFTPDLSSILPHPSTHLTSQPSS